jgi:hypothetical protein
VEACNIPRTDFLSPSDLYLTLHLSTTSAVQSTQVIEKTQSPIWDQHFHFAIPSGRQTDACLTCIVKNYSGLGFDPEVVRTVVPLSDLVLFAISDRWFVLEPGISDGTVARQPPKVRIVRQIAPAGHTAFMPARPQQAFGMQYGAWEESGRATYREEQLYRT